MKKRRVVSVIMLTVLVLTLVTSFCSCAGTENEDEHVSWKEIEEDIWILEQTKVQTYKLGGNKLRRAEVEVTYVNQVDDIKCEVSGRITFVDVYDNEWKNTFDCIATKNLQDDERWVITNMKYTNSSWDKN